MLDFDGSEVMYEFWIPKEVNMIVVFVLNLEVLFSRLRRVFTESIYFGLVFRLHLIL